MRVALPVLLMTLAACGGTASESDGDAVEQGRRLALANCAGCHSISESGASPHAEAPPFRTLSERFEITALQEALVEGIMVGHPDMPEFLFEPDEADALIAFIESLQTDN